MTKRIKTASLKDRFAERVKTKWVRIVILFLIPYSLLLCPSCDPEAPWETDNVKVSIHVQYVSAAFIECEFATNKDAYYLIACELARDDYNPMDHQKQFMTLALDSANAAYLAWRERLLRDGEFNVAPFSSHALQYGAIHHFFTGLEKDRKYWIYAFAVNPKTREPVGKLFLQEVTTKQVSEVDAHFNYRVKGAWDYIYPVDSLGNIFSHFPYIATTRDSLDIKPEEGLLSVLGYFMNWASDMYMKPDSARVYYGVQAVENDGTDGHAAFKEGHVYYTAIAGYDGGYQQLTIYKFRWTEDIDFYYKDTDSANVAITNQW